MRELTVNTFLSLDGVMQAPGGPDEDPDGGFELGGWSVTYWDEVMGEVMDAAMAAPFDLLLGRRTFDIFEAHWPHTGDEVGALFTKATKYVVSTTRSASDWENTVFLDGDVPAAIAELKAGDGPELQVHGSANLLQTLIRHGLVDRYRIWTFPVLLGRGKRLFGEGSVPGGLELTDLTRSTTGVLITTYRPDGEVEIGSFALDDA